MSRSSSTTLGGQSSCLCIGGLENSTIATIAFLSIGILTMLLGTFIPGLDLNARNGILIAGFITFCVGILGCLYTAGKSCYKK